jgi:beta-glucosidase
MTTFLKFPPDFVWGAIASSYQIEGGWNEDGKGLSIWDTFVRQPGIIERGETGNTAADHYHRWREDIELIGELGLKSYCFSVSWPRILPEGVGSLNPAGLGFYDRLIDGLLEKGITPFIMLYHWELPQALQDKGGWGERDTAFAFAEYGRILAQHFGDRVPLWVTHNEPMVSAILGHLTGEHAPGIKDLDVAMRAVHHLLLSHGLAVESLRAELPSAAQISIILNLTPTYAASEKEEDRQAARRFDGVANRLFLDPLLRGEYSADVLEMMGAFFPPMQEGDLKIIAAPLDFLGVNYYTRAVMRYDPQVPGVQASDIHPPQSEYSQMWEIYPPGIYDLLERVWEEYHPPRIFVTENGVCVPDGVDFDGRVRDERRIRFIRTHLAQVHRAIQAGIPVEGYFYWAWIDNFEWNFGYRMRFGLIYVDFETQRRIMKDSGRWYARTIHENGFHDEVN